MNKTLHSPVVSETALYEAHNGRLGSSSDDLNCSQETLPHGIGVNELL